MAAANTKNRGATLEVQSVYGSLETLLARLLPLTSVERRRFLFMPTRSDWTAFADNGHHGTDAFAPISYLAKKIECDGVSATDAQAGRTQGGTLFEMYSPKNTDCLNIARTISASPTDGRWNFCMSGIMLPFEKPEFYKRKRVKDRFNAAILKQYLEELGINAFDPEFYSNDGILVEKTGASAPTMQQFDLAF